MRKAFTLIELMIVIAIIAIIASIAIPNLLESRITANEAAAAGTLKSGLMPAQVQFQAGAYSDNDSDGRGEYAKDHSWLAGLSKVAPGVGESPRTLSLMPPAYNVSDRTAIGPYKFQVDVLTSAATQAATFFAGYAFPNTNSDGRRAFAINPTGAVITTKQTYAEAKLTTGAVTGNTTDSNNGTGWAAADAIYATDPCITNATYHATNAAPYTK